MGQGNAAIYIGRDNKDFVTFNHIQNIDISRYDEKLIEDMILISNLKLLFYSVLFDESDIIT